MEFLAHRRAVGESPQGVGLQCPQGESGLQVVGVELEELARDPLAYVNDIGGSVDVPPGQFGDDDESDTGEERMGRSVVQGHEDPEPLDRRNGARQDVAAVQGLQKRPEFRALRLPIHTVTLAHDMAGRP
ncbi:hypothetical protein Shyd_73010 [Streptomyces hydrogenans]|uniref:Uncharacterized protein n=1 Tax=Streptomyces hydrogenans TaxID=1873719 RepID=A0ABQ3PLN8_9ACTN|nr:hypothetical protein Shyd_73010 [Streptomyces hydrogenans]